MVECKCDDSGEIIIELPKIYVGMMDNLVYYYHSSMHVVDGIDIAYDIMSNGLTVVLVDKWTNTISMFTLPCKELKVITDKDKPRIRNELGKVLFPKDLRKDMGYAKAVAKILVKHLCVNGDM